MWRTRIVFGIFGGFAAHGVLCTAKTLGQQVTDVRLKLLLTLGCLVVFCLALAWLCRVPRRPDTHGGSSHVHHSAL